MIGRCIAVFVVLSLAACSNPDEHGFQGWVEADLIFVSPDEAGRVQTLSVREGDEIAQGAPLFTVDDDLQRSDLEMAQATLTNTRQAFDRAKRLVASAAGTQRALEEAEAALRTAEARFNAAQTRLARRTMMSPVSGSVQQIYFRQGELAPAGRPVVALLPPGNIKIRFFVPEAQLPTIAIGDPVQIQCDGCTSEVRARISFISRTSEFTPPVIFSQEERAKLVFLVEARTDAPQALRVGQPVTVLPESKR